MNLPDAFGRILASLQRAALNDAHWPETAAWIEAACGSRGNMLVVGDDAHVHFYRYVYRGEPRQDLAHRYFNDYYPHDEAPPRIMALPAGRPVHVPELYTETELKESPAYNEGWGLCHGRNGLVARLDGLDGLRLVWAVADPAAGVGWRPAQLQMVESLLPHVWQFVRIRQALAGANSLNVGVAGLLCNSGIGVLQLDRGGRVLAANDTAVDILRRGEELFDRDGTLHASVPADHGRLRRLLKRALPGFGGEPPTGGSMMVERSGFRSRLALHVHPVTAEEADFGGRRVAALVLAVEPESRAPIDPVRVATLLGLKPSEGRVTALLSEGRTVSEIAADTGFTEGYVRYLLKQVYKKQGVSRQVDLVRRVLTAHGLPPR